MAITRWNPYSELASMQDQMNHLFKDLWGGRNREGVEYGAWIPAVDLREEQKQYVIEADLPGVNKDDIDINVENNVLTISGERHFSNEEKKDSYHRIERTYGKFMRSFTLPSRVSSGKVSATFKDGILEVVIPKTEDAQPKKIKIQS